MHFAALGVLVFYYVLVVHRYHTGNSRRQAKKGSPKKNRIENIAEWIGKSFASHGTQSTGVERAGEEVRHDAPLRLHAELRDQGKARHTPI